MKKIKKVVPGMGIGSYLLLHCLQLFLVEAGETFQLLLLPFQLFSLGKKKWKRSREHNENMKRNGKRNIKM